MSAEKASIQIPKVLAERIQRRLSSTDFSSVDDYITYVLEQVLHDLEDQKNEEKIFSKEDQENVERRLRDLGYI
jgi:Arc/MetJ-type ribon-helix-helix transcriptional regulator